MELAPPEPTAALLNDANTLVKRIQAAANTTKSNRQSLSMLSRRVTDTVQPLSAISDAHTQTQASYTVSVEAILYPSIIDLINVLAKILEVVTKHGNRRHPLAFFNVFNYLHVRDQIIQANRSLDRIIGVFLNVLEQTMTVTGIDARAQDAWEAARQKWVELKAISYKRRKEMVEVLKQEFDQAEITDADMEDLGLALEVPEAAQTVSTELLSEPSTDWTGVTEINDTQLETLIIKRRSIPLVQLAGPIEDMFKEATDEKAKPETILEEAGIPVAQTITQELIASADEATKVYAEMDVGEKLQETKTSDLELYISKIVSEGTIEFIPYNQFSVS